MSEEEVESPIAFTARYVCGLRCVEGRSVENPLIVDPLAPILCGSRGLKLAEEELINLRAAQGEGKHLRVPARNRLVDDEISSATQALAGIGENQVQVLCLGCGLDSRPWRLTLPSNLKVIWFDVDFDEMMQLKEKLLRQSGVQTTHDDCLDSSFEFPLMVSSYRSVGLDLSKDIAKHLGQKLESSGFDPKLPCVWCLEAVIYYMELASACSLLQAMADLSLQGGAPSRLVATCVDHDLLAASQSMAPGSHIFAGLWHFDVDELLSHPSYCQRWKTVATPRTAKDLAKELYNAETYVALYGGAECVFTAELSGASPT